MISTLILKFCTFIEFGLSILVISIFVRITSTDLYKYNKTQANLVHITSSVFRVLVKSTVKLGYNELGYNERIFWPQKSI